MKLTLVDITIGKWKIEKANQEKALERMKNDFPKELALHEYIKHEIWQIENMIADLNNIKYVNED